jgi:hypothetical protein
MPWDEVLRKFKEGELHSGGPQGPKITNRKQAIAVMLSEKRKSEGTGAKADEYKSHPARKAFGR